MDIRKADPYEADSHAVREREERSRSCGRDASLSVHIASELMRSYDKHDKCGLVWIPRVVAYRCRTCGISPCMSICRECFHRGDHSTHDFNMFLSQAGGACDCGDNSVMKEDG
ncbi:E3 ubiquitin-protein ligase Ubr3 [Eumeta japonica]|uniref:E3 ubiquitin-protein ligase n=1 Tax=Eumeta variegata TaxID=151549 RepID=A0A4C1U753_EUMVA|nr:E3 ubiquitin-protein ligase Ubr3 [Eumeta japonica]